MSKSAMLKLLRWMLGQLRQTTGEEDATCTCYSCRMMRKAARVLKEATR